MFSCLRKKKMRTRSMILFTTITIFILGICVLIIWVNGLIFDRLLTEASMEIYKKETFKTHYYSSANYLSYYSKMLQSNENSLRALNGLYAFINPYIQNLDEITINEEINLNFGATQGIPQSVVNLKWEKYDIYFGAQCYQNMGQLSNPLSRKDLISIKIQEFYTIFGSITYKGSIINQKQLYGFMENQDQFTEYPCVNYQSLLQGYNFKNGFRYQEAKIGYQQNDIQATLSPPAASKIFMDTSITMVLPILDELAQFNGYWASIIIPPKIQDFFEFNQKSIKTFFLLTREGVLLSHPYNITYDQLPLYIFNESITGFNEEDWREILSENPQSNCEEYFGLNMKILCRQNSIFKRELSISIYNLEKYNLFLLRVNDDLEYKTFINDFQIHIQKSITAQITVNAYYQLGLFVVVSIILLIVTYYLFLPIDFIIESCIDRMKNQGTLSFFKGDLSTKNKLLMSMDMKCLYDASMNFFHKLTSLSCSKSFYCKFIENIKPHKKEANDIKEFLDNLKIKKQNIHDYKEVSFENQLYSILNALKQCQILQDQDNTQLKYWNSNWEFQNQIFERSLEQSQKNFDNLNQ